MKNIHTKEEMLRTGVYKITCTINNRFYIGSASCINASTSKRGFLGRYNIHTKSLIENKHKNVILQNSFNKYGIDNFTFSIIEYCNPEDCKDKEQFYLDILQPFYPKGFNICKNALCNNTKNNTKTRISTRDITNLNNHLKVAVIQRDLNNDILHEYEGIANAARLTNTHRVAIYKCCKKEYKTAGGYIWEYKYPKNNITTITPKFNIKVTNLVTNEITIYKTLTETSHNIDYCKSTIRIHIQNSSPIENKYIVEKIIL